jgi:hypothetical protein
MSTQGIRSLVVDQDDKVVATMISKKNMIEPGKAHNTSVLNVVKSTRKWHPFLSTFVLNQMSEIMKIGFRTENGFKEVHLNNVAKKVFECCRQEVSLQQESNHMRKWKAWRIHVSKMRDLSGAG